MNKKPPNTPTEAANNNGSQVELPPQMETIPTIPVVPNPWIINVPQQEPQAQKEKAHCIATLALSVQQLT
jgi:hypothetical protein